MTTGSDRLNARHQQAGRCCSCAPVLCIPSLRTCRGQGLLRRSSAVGSGLSFLTTTQLLAYALAVDAVRPDALRKACRLGSRACDHCKPCETSLHPRCSEANRLRSTSCALLRAEARDRNGSPSPSPHRETSAVGCRAKDSPSLADREDHGPHEHAPEDRQQATFTLGKLIQAVHAYPLDAVQSALTSPANRASGWAHTARGEASGLPSHAWSV